MNKYHQILQKVLTHGKYQTNKKGSIRYLLNEQLVLSPADLLDMTITDFTLHFSCCFTKLLHSLFITLLNNFTM